MYKRQVNAGEDNLTDYLEDLKQSTAGSYLDGLDDQNLSKRLRDLMVNNMTYMLMLRCGLETKALFEADDFREITTFNTPQTINIIGSATCEITATALGAIAKTVRRLQREEKNEMCIRDRSKELKLELPSVDELFTTEEERLDANREKVQEIPLDQIEDFPNHPFKIKEDEAMMEMAESIKEYGVLVPALVRQKANGSYEMVAGHRRKCASRLAGMKEIPCIAVSYTHLDVYKRQ